MELDAKTVESMLRCFQWLIALVIILTILVAINTGLYVYEYWERRSASGSVVVNRLHKKIWLFFLSSG